MHGLHYFDLRYYVEKREKLYNVNSNNVINHAGCVCVCTRVVYLYNINLLRGQVDPRFTCTVYMHKSNYEPVKRTRFDTRCIGGICRRGSVNGVCFRELAR